MTSSRCGVASSAISSPCDGHFSTRVAAFLLCDATREKAEGAMKHLSVRFGEAAGALSAARRQHAAWLLALNVHNGGRASERARPHRLLPIMAASVASCEELETADRADENNRIENIYVYTCRIIKEAASSRLPAWYIDI